MFLSNLDIIDLHSYAGYTQERMPGGYLSIRNSLIAARKHSLTVRYRCGPIVLVPYVMFDVLQQCMNICTLSLFLFLFF